MISDLVSRGALFVVNHSGGKDSQAMLIRILKQVPASQVMVIHASLGEHEWPGTLEHAEKQSSDAGLPFIVARSTKTFFGMVEHRFSVRPDAPCWPSASNRQCTSDLKRGPIERETRRYVTPRGLSLIVNCMGLRADESHSRAKLATFKKNDRCSVAGREWYDWLPIHDLTRDEVFATIRDAGQQPHWAYAEGNDRLSCVFCIMGSANDIANGARLRPDLFAKYVEIEQRTGYTMHMSRKSLTQIAGSASQPELIQITRRASSHA
jgi:3'-phosphoadenosine 5'-phosphosulfate sulfotransferase (PAPS reductase)/FAD synthetase